MTKRDVFMCKIGIVAFNVFVSLIIISSLSAQDKNISGVWVLKERKSLYGIDYANAVPRVITVSMQFDTISISVLTDTDRGSDTVYFESLNLSGVPKITITASERHKITFIKAKSIDNCLLRRSEYSSPSNPQMEDFVRESKFCIDEQGQTMVVVNTHFSKMNEMDQWAVRAVYQRTSESQLAKDTSLGTGISFIQNLEWEQMLHRAKSQNKYIFIDCFATWCGPCKAMDNKVYPNNKVADFMNRFFVNVKLQMDSSRNDDEQTVKWYPIANRIIKQYSIQGYPTYLFLSPTGQLVHRDEGYLGVDKFLEVANNALDSNKQFYPLLSRYKAGGNLDHSVLIYLAKAVKNSGDKQLSNKIARDYINKYLNKCSDSILYLKENVDFIYSFSDVLTTHDKFFNVFYNNPQRIDIISGFVTRGITESFCSMIITKTEVTDKFYLPNDNVRKKKPNWQKITNLIELKYKGVDAERLVSDAKFWYYLRAKKWTELIACFVERVEHYGVGVLPDANFDRFITTVITLHSDDTVLLQRAIGWMDEKMKNLPENMRKNFYGGYGVLLYKVGRVKEGIMFFEKHLEIRKGNLAKLETLERMKRGEKVNENWREESID